MFDIQEKLMKYNWSAWIGENFAYTIVRTIKMINIYKDKPLSYRLDIIRFGKPFKRYIPYLVTLISIGPK